MSSKKLQVYKSSAGSGKTTRLAIEYIKLALSYPDAYKRIIALTFTNKAAQEMKERILRFLSQIVTMQANDGTFPFFVEDVLQSQLRYRQHLIQDRAKALQLLQADATRLFKSILHHYSDFSVSTLDSFTNRIIRSFSYDLGISFNYQVELDTDDLLQLSVDELINKVNIDEKVLNTVLTTFSRSKIDNEKSRRISEDLQRRAKSLLNDVEEPFLQHLRHQNIESLFALYPKLKKKIATYTHELSAFGKAFLRLCVQHNMQSHMFYYGHQTIYPYFKRIADGNFEKLTPNKRILEIIEHGKWTTKKEYKNKLEALAPQILAIYNEMHLFIEAKQSDYLLQLEILNNFFPYMVLVELEKELNRIKLENELLHISDFNKLIAEKIANESSPYIFERIGNRYHHFLLDEFQDTSAIQWSNLIPLVENALSEGHYNLIVGDAKQSIYRWRGADAEQFVQLPALSAENNAMLKESRERIFAQAYQEFVLNTNYRSAATIVNFNNGFFSFLLKEVDKLPEIVHKVYAEVEQKSAHRTAEHPNAFVELRQVETADIRRKEEALDLYAKSTIAAIKEAVHLKYDYKDIAVLCRNNKDIVAMSEVCIEHNIPFVSSESVEIDSLDLISFVFSFVHYLQFDTELVYQTEILSYLHRHHYLNTDADYAYVLQNNKAEDALLSVWNMLGIEVNKEYLLALDAYEGVEAIARLFKLARQHPFFHFFLEAALKFSQEHHQGLVAFALWWEQHSKDFVVELPQEKDAVRLMSFHKAKGLEFPVVITWFSDMLNKVGNKNEKLWLSPDLEDFPEIKSFPFSLKALAGTKFADRIVDEEAMEVLDNLNLLYVALTRPTQALYVLYDTYLAVSNRNKEKFYALSYADIFSQYVKKVQTLGKQVGNALVMGKKGDALLASVACSQQPYELMRCAYSSVDWQQCIDLQVEEEKMWQLSMPIQYGIKVHKLLSYIYTPADIDNALNKMYFSALINQTEYAKLKDSLLQITAHPQLAAYYSPQAKVYNEVELCQSSGAIFRPDRLVISDAHCVVIDYKTGAEQAAHTEQLQHYMALAADFTQKPVKGFLVYIGKTIDVKAMVV